MRNYNHNFKQNLSKKRMIWRSDSSTQKWHQTRVGWTYSSNLFIDLICLSMDLHDKDTFTDSTWLLSITVILLLYTASLCLHVIVLQVYLPPVKPLFSGEKMEVSSCSFAWRPLGGALTSLWRSHCTSPWGRTPEWHIPWSRQCCLC